MMMMMMMMMKEKEEKTKKEEEENNKKKEKKKKKGEESELHLINYLQLSLMPTSPSQFQKFPTLSTFSMLS
jgi:hypothetical protein